jgi:hypothetical protein
MFNMKIVPFCFFMFLFLVLKPLGLFSQQTDAAAIASATINPISLTKEEDMDLGNVSMTFAGTVELIKSGTSPSRKGDVVFPIATASFTAVALHVAGSKGLSFRVTQPSRPFTVGRGANAMTVISFTIDPTVNAPPGQTAGIFVMTTPSNIIVNYN